MDNKNSMILGGAVLIMILAAVFFGMQSRSTTTNIEVNNPPQAPSEAMVEATQVPEQTTVTPSEAMMEEKKEQPVKEFNIKAKPLSFDVKTITVKKGDKVKVTLTNEEGKHDFVIDEFSARTRILPAGESETIEIFPDKVGTFEFYCSVEGHREMGMVGKFIVEE